MTTNNRQLQQNNRHRPMKLTVTTKELLDLLRDERKYNDGCNHEGFDPCCVFCQSKRVLQAEEEGELYVNNNHK